MGVRARALYKVLYTAAVMVLWLSWAYLLPKNKTSPDNNCFLSLSSLHSMLNT